MNIIDGVCWGFIPARGGSKSVPMKNIADLYGRPLLDYCATASLNSNNVTRTICSTDSSEIESRCRALNIEVHERPLKLSKDNTAVFDVISDFVGDLVRKGEGVAEMIALLQPTSPFILPNQIDSCINLLNQNTSAGSVQTVIPCPHNHHAFNQRSINDGQVVFKFPDERKKGYNKQKKKPLFLFGNLVVFKTKSAIEQATVFAESSYCIKIPELFGFDCDGSLDFKVGEALLAAKLIDLPHL